MNKHRHFGHAPLSQSKANEKGKAIGMRAVLFHVDNNDSYSNSYNGGGNNSKYIFTRNNIERDRWLMTRIEHNNNIN